MQERLQFFIDGAWVDPIAPAPLDVINPATEEVCGRISLGGAEDVDRAVKAARAAFPAWSSSTRERRLEILKRSVELYQARMEEMVTTISQEMGAPVWLCKMGQAPVYLGHAAATIAALEKFEFETARDGVLITREAIGVCAMITPWNWPINQVACKVLPALAAGCTVVLKPAELAPLSAMLLAEILHESGVPAGVFNLVNGDGPTVGQALSRHPEVDMVSFTGSTRAGVAVAKAAADTVKRVSQELGGKGPNIILRSANFDVAVKAGVEYCFLNSGQSCGAPTRMLVPKELHERAIEVAKAAADGTVAGDPTGQVNIGPVVSQRHYDRIQGLIKRGVDEGATLVSGGLGKPEGIEKGYYVRPTVFANVRNDMTIAREEIFGPVLVIIPYETEDEAVELANDSPYGLSGYVEGDPDQARAIARRIRCGQVHLNGAPFTCDAPFGGFKQSGNGREYAEYGIAEFLETRALLGYSGNTKRGDEPS